MIPARAITNPSARSLGMLAGPRGLFDQDVEPFYDALIARDPGPNHTLTDPAVLDDFVQAPVWNRDMGRDMNGHDRPAGSIAGCCGHYARITDGVHNPVEPPGPINEPDWPRR